MKRKEKRYLNLGEKFEENNGLYIRNNYNGLYDCYGRPSERKYNIYNYYFNLLRNNCDEVIKYGIASYNTSFITLEAEIIKDDKMYYLLITPSYNYYVEIEEV